MSNRKHDPQGRATRSSAGMLWPALGVAGLIVLITAGIAGQSRPETPSASADVVVYKTAACGCCKNWVAHLRADGLQVAVVNVADTRSARQRLGVPRMLGSCHTAEAGDYFVEGHVPADLVRRLLVEQPADIRGIAVPGMPMGSPGMEGPNAVAYEVLSVNAEGDVALYARRQGKRHP